MSKRKRSSENRPTKKQRLDTVALINNMQDTDEDRAIELEELDATKAVEFAYKEAMRRIKKEFRTLKPERVLPKRRLQLEQRLEYEESKKQDRIAQINARTREKTQEIEKKRQERRKRQELDEKIEECLDLPDFENATWQTIGKFRCVTKRLAECDMSNCQEARFQQVLAELTSRGWRIKQQTKNIKAQPKKQNDATSSATRRPSTDRPSEIG